MPLLEIIATTVNDCLNAQKAGADRIELVENLHEGGTTPSYATILLSKKYLKIPVSVMIRPRVGNFFYNDIEFETMCKDIEICKNIGVDGVVFGMLTNDFFVDKLRCDKLIKLAKPMQITFHRAFDVVKNPLKAMEILIDLNVDRILTSGQKNTAWDGKELLVELVQKAKDRIIILPGSGIRDTNIKEIASIIKAKEFHSSARTASEKSVVNAEMIINMKNSLTNF